jgi:hypothetical protein
VRRVRLVGPERRLPGGRLLLAGRVLLATLAAVGVSSALAAFASAAAAGGATISLHASPRQPRTGQPVTLTGQSTGEPAGTPVRLYTSRYPYQSTRLLQAGSTDAQGSFTFVVHPDRNVRYRAAVVGTNLAATVQISVVGKAVTTVAARPLGQAGVRVLIFHPRDLLWGGRQVSWSFAQGFHGPFFRAQSTRSIRLSPYLTLLGTTITLPAGHFRWRACFHAPGDHALLSLRRPPGCTGRGYHGGGYLPVGFPATAAVARGAAYLSTRIGRTAFAVVDSEGRMSGVNIHRTFPTASVVKAMLLVAYLRRLHSMGQHTVDSYSNSFLYPMIHISDNTAATQTWSIVGDSGLYSVAGLAGMTDFSVNGLWGTALISPADQAHFFFIMDSLIPHEFVGYARYLLSTIVGWQSWGIAAVARGLGYTAFFKDGSEPTGLGELVHQVDRLEGHGRKLAIAVMTDGNPSMQYGIDTLQGTAAALLR